MPVSILVKLDSSGPEVTIGTTVVIPAYNASGTLGRAITSVLNAGAVEVIVVDDGSTDDTASIARSRGCQLVEQSNAGAGAARVNGLKRVKTEYVIFLDSDDELCESAVTVLEQLMATRTDAVGALGQYRPRDSDGVVGAAIPFWREGIDFGSLLDRGFAPGPPGVFMWRRNGLEKSIYSDPSLLLPRYADDYELVLRMSWMNTIVAIGQPVCIYDASGGKSALGPLESLRSAERLRRYYSAVFDSDIRLRSERELILLSEFRKLFSISSVMGVERFLLMAKIIIKSRSAGLGFVVRSIFRRIRRIRNA